VLNGTGSHAEFISASALDIVHRFRNEFGMTLSNELFGQLRLYARLKGPLWRFDAGRRMQAFAGTPESGIQGGVRSRCFEPVVRERKKNKKIIYFA
ncbi:MAG TPA: hypothetical protein DCZ74_05405, partial [Treponema sp.]|nr:hypothetical protein [Treponema sp.]